MKISSRLAIPLMISFFALCANFQAAAATLDSNAARSLISDHTWQQPSYSGPGSNYWSWKSDGSLCLRTEDKKNKCADTGHWKLDAERLCYELTWWGASDGRNAACFRITDLGKGRYEALQDSGFTLFEFSVVE